MTAIDKTLLENLQLLDEAKRLKSAGFVTADQVNEAKKQLELPKTNSNLLVRIGFFLLGSFLFSSLSGVLSLILLGMLEAMNSHYEIIMYIYAILGCVVTELLASKKYFAYGLDDAFILGSQCILFAAIGISSESVTATFAAMAIFGGISCVRYVNTISSLFCVIGIAGFFASLIIDKEIIGTAFLPFVMLFVAIGLFLGYRKLSTNPNARLYENSLGVVKACSIILAYLSVNYLVVRELSEELMNITVAPGEDIPFAFLFYIFTFAIPAAYLVYSIKMKDRMLFILGLLAVAFTVFTIRFYYSVMPIEIALVLGGIVVFGATYFFIRKIRHNDTGITFKPDRYTDSEALSYAQAIIANSHSHIRTVTTAESPMPFGGGGFSGGGAGENY